MSHSFKAVPELKEFQIPFQLKENLLLDWLQNLSGTESRQACAEILQLLQTLNQNRGLSAKNRFAFVKLIYEYSQIHIQNLTRTCWDSSWPISAQEQDYIEAAVWNYLVLAEGFFMAAQYLGNRADEVSALYMSCRCLEQAQLHIAAVYSSPAPLFWQLLYQIFTWIEKYNLFSSKINIEHNKNITLNDALAPLFVFQICDTYQFRPRDMQTIFNFLPKVCKNFAIYKLSDIKFQNNILKIPYLQAVANNLGSLADDLIELIYQRQDLIVFDINQTNPPVILNPAYSLTTTSLRYFTAASVVEELDKVLESGEVWSGILKSINYELFTRVIKTLAPGRKRRHARSATERTLLGIIGFEDIVSFLYQVQHKNSQQIQSQPVKQKGSGTDTLALTTHVENRHPQMGAIDGGFSEMEFILQAEQNSIWNYKNNLNVINKAVVLKRLTIFDHSAGGYLLHWTDNESLKAKVGDIFAVISEDRKRLEIALIRRIAITSHDYKFGTEILGLSSEAVIITHTDNYSSGGWAIFIPSVQTPERTQPATIIYPIGRFHKGDNIYIHKNNKKITASIVAELNVTATITHAELSLISPDSKN